jgi:hypothetical protein
MSWNVQAENIGSESIYDDVDAKFQEQYADASDRVRAQFHEAAAAADNIAWDTLGASEDGARFNIQLSGHDSSDDTDENKVNNFVSVIVTRLPDAAEAEKSPEKETASV